MPDSRQFSCLFLYSRLQGYGVQSHLETLSASLIGENVITALIAREGAGSSQLDRSHFSKTILLGENDVAPMALLKLIVAIRTHILDQKPDILHSHHRLTTLAARIANSSAKIPLFVTVHEKWQNYRWFGAAFQGDRTIVMSTQMQKHLSHRFGFDPSRIRIIPNGIGVPSSPAHQTPARNPDIFRLGFLGRLSSEKGAIVLLEAFIKLAQKYPDICLTFAGEGPEMQFLLENARLAGIHDRVSFPGRIREVGSFLRSLDLLIVPSFEDNFPTVILEAMREKVPVIATDVGGIPEIITDRETGLLVPCGQPAALAGKIEELKKDPEVRFELANQAYQVFLSRFTAPIMAERLRKIYDERLQV